MVVAINPSQRLQRQRMLDDISNDVLAIRYRDKCMSYTMRKTAVPGLTHVADALGERSLQRAVLLSEETEVHIFAPVEAGGPNEWDARLALAHILNRAEVFLWRQVVMVEVKEMTLPAHVISRGVLPYPNMYLTFEDALRVVDTTTMQVEYATDWILLYDVPSHDGFVIMMPQTAIDANNNETGLQIVGILVNYNKRWPEDFYASGTNDEAARTPVGYVLNLLAFLNSPYVAADKAQPERAARREVKRHGGAEPDGVHMVALRAPAEKPQPSGAHTGPRTPYSASGHWHVKGHLRAQWYPKEKAHHVLYIAPQIRGDLSKPLKKRAFGVVR